MSRSTYYSYDLPGAKSIRDVVSSISLLYEARCYAKASWAIRSSVLFGNHESLETGKNAILLKFNNSTIDLLQVATALWKELDGCSIYMTDVKDEEHPLLIVFREVVVDDDDDDDDDDEKTIMTPREFDELSNAILGTLLSGIKDNNLLTLDLIETLRVQENANPLTVASNDPQSVFKILGIEAARSVLISELTKVLKFDGTYVNTRHVMLLVDHMTKSGKMLPMNRYGLKHDSSPLSQASFETATTSLAHSAVNNRRDILCGVSERLIVGAMANVGTGSDTELILDEEMLERHAVAPMSSIITNPEDDDAIIINNMSPYDGDDGNALSPPRHNNNSPGQMSSYTPLLFSPQFSPDVHGPKSPAYHRPSMSVNHNNDGDSPAYCPASPIGAPVYEDEDGGDVNSLMDSLFSSHSSSDDTSPS